VRISPYCDSEVVGAGTVVFSHGFTVAGFESRRMFLDLANRLAARGIAAVLFDYRGSGYSDLAFDEMTLESELEDLQAVLAVVAEPRPRPLVVWAMSLGTAIAAKHVHDHPGTLDALVLWGSAAGLPRRWHDRYAARLAEGTPLLHKSGLPVTRRLVESSRGFDIEDNLRGSTLPLLFVHGTNDEAADVSLVEDMLPRLRRHVDTVILPGGNHGFHHQPETYERAATMSVGWIEQLTTCDATGGDQHIRTASRDPLSRLLRDTVGTRLHQ
jgi:alpha-beta hydrolase superfamily lysophospholipase